MPLYGLHMKIVKNFVRYIYHFADHPFVVEVGVTGYLDTGDGDLAFAEIEAQDVGITSCVGIATYPIDGEAIVFGFKTTAEAQPYANAVEAKVEEIDVTLARKARGVKNAAYALWFWKSNLHSCDLSWEEFRRTDAWVATSFDDASLDVRIAAERLFKRMFPGMPEVRTADDLVGDIKP